MHVRFDHALKALDKKEYEGARQGFKALVENGSFQAVPYLLAFSGKVKENLFSGELLPQKALDDQRLDILLDLALLGEVQRGTSLEKAYKLLCKGVPRNAKAAKKKKQQEKLNKLSRVLFKRDSRLELLEQVYDPRICSLIENKFPLDTYNVEDFSKTVLTTTARAKMSQKYAALKVVTNYGNFNSKGGKVDALLCEVLDNVAGILTMAERIFYAGYRAVYLEDYRHIFEGRGFQKHQEKVYEHLLPLKNSGLQYKYAVVLYNDKDFKEARQYFKQAADRGHREAQHKYAFVLYKGEGGDKDLPLARHYFQLAAGQGYVKAQYMYAEMLCAREGGDEDLSLARENYRMAAEGGNEYAEHEYAYMLREGRGGGKDLPLAREIFRRNAAKNNSDSQYRYAYILRTGEGGDKDLPLARHYFQLAADQGISNAQYECGVMFRYGRGGKEDLPLARKYYKMAADQGSKYAQNNYACMLCMGKGGDKDFKEAFEYCLLAEKQDFSQGLYAWMLYNGKGVDVDIEKACVYYQNAADQGNIGAKAKLAKIKKQKREELTTQNVDELGGISIRSVYIGEEPEEDSEGADDGGGGRKETSSEEHDMESKQEEVGAEREEAAKAETCQISHSSVYFREREEGVMPDLSMLEMEEDSLDRIENPKAQAFVRAFFEGGHEAKALKYGEFLKTLKNLPVNLELTTTRSGMRARVDNPMSEVQSAILTWHNPHRGSNMDFNKGDFRSSLVDFFHNLGYHKP